MRTHVDEFNFFTKNSSRWIDWIASVFLIKEHGPCSYYLDNDFIYCDGQDIWIYGVEPYGKQAIDWVENMYDCLHKESTHIPVTEYHPELDEAPLLLVLEYLVFAIQHNYL